MLLTFQVTSFTGAHRAGGGRGVQGATQLVGRQRCGQAVDGGTKLPLRRFRVAHAAAPARVLGPAAATRASGPPG
jgi:hypothetical protein